MRYFMKTGAPTGRQTGRGLYRLLMGGLVAGSFGLVPAAQTPDSRGDAGSLGSGSARSAPYDTARSPSSTASGGPIMDTSLAGTVSKAAGNLPPNVTPGWKIRVCSEKTQVDNITFRFSQPGRDEKDKGGNRSDRDGKAGTASGKPHSNRTSAEQAEARQGTGGLASDTARMVQQTAIWSRGSASEIAVPTGLREADRLRIEAIGQDDKEASVCVLYNDHVAGEMDFDDREVATLRKNQNGECGC